MVADNLLAATHHLLLQEAKKGSLRAAQLKKLAAHVEKTAAAVRDAVDMRHKTMNKAFRAVDKDGSHKLSHDELLCVPRDRTAAALATAVVQPSH